MSVGPLELGILLIVGIAIFGPWLIRRWKAVAAEARSGNE